ncbi:MAG: hypothetical protein WC635_00990 [Bacteriovorax sp.]|jgi:hypothetical protein
MKRLSPFTISSTLIILAFLLLSACVQGTGTRAKSIAKKTTKVTGTDTTGTLGAIDGTTTTDGTSTVISQQVELSHLVDPFDGTYKKKLTLPKNFKGNLYLAGLNVSSLVDKIVSVRFNFGVDKQSVTLKATVARAPGIIPKTDIQVLVIDMNQSPFKSMRLNYDLYDYNDYAADPTLEMVSDPRDGGLFCRGLRLEDDPTFIPLTQTSTCSDAASKCLYSYAKVVDTTLYDDRIIDSVTQRVSSIPSRAQVWSESSGVRSPLVSSMTGSACLPDDEDESGLNQFLDTTFLSLSYEMPVLGYFYRGPYRSINDSDWQISGDAVYNTTNGLFQTRPLSITQITGFHSLMFPRAGKLALNQGVSYLGSTDKIGPRAKMTSDSTGTSQYVDGCNIRTLNVDPATNESISSCNVNATIEVFYMSEGKEVIITTDKSIKLQLIRSSITNFLGQEVLSTSFKRCESSTTCGSNECCFNSRCWSKDLVTQCVDATPIVGNQEIGANCSSDFECSSLCCNQSTGSCSPHNPNGTNPIFCSKNSGQQCVAKEFCKQEAVVTCKIVKSGFNADGTAACTLRCPAVMTYGNCTNGACVPPVQPAVPAFDPTDCSKAVDP